MSSVNCHTLTLPDTECKEINARFVDRLVIPKGSKFHGDTLKFGDKLQYSIDFGTKVNAEDKEAIETQLADHSVTLIFE